MSGTGIPKPPPARQTAERADFRPRERKNADHMDRRFYLNFLVA